MENLVISLQDIQCKKNTEYKYQDEILFSVFGLRKIYYTEVKVGISNN